MNLIYKAILGLGFFPYISRIHTAYIGEDSSILGSSRVWCRDPSPVDHLKLVVRSKGILPTCANNSGLGISFLPETNISRT